MHNVMQLSVEIPFEAISCQLPRRKDMSHHVAKNTIICHHTIELQLWSLGNNASIAFVSPSPKKKEELKNSKITSFTVSAKKL